MNLKEYLSDKIIVLLINITGALSLSLYLLATGNYYTSICLILIAWGFILICYFSVDYYFRKKYFNEMMKILDELDKRYLIGEVHNTEPRLEDKLYHNIIRKSNKSVIEEIRQLEDSKRDYKEYIEGWIHDVKSPLTAISLMCENNRENAVNLSENVDDLRNSIRKIQLETGIIERQVDNVLYYARSEETYKDYLIHKVNLREVVMEEIKNNKLYFIQVHMQIQMELEDIMVSTDEKWVGFLINQIFSNSIKYARNEQAILKISSMCGDKNISLVIEDNGHGIPENEIGRIFEKGFTGTNGRMGKDAGRKSTGLGLYLCKKLCDKLEIGIMCESIEGSFTKMILIFPNSDFTGNLSKM